MKKRIINSLVIILGDFLLAVGIGLFILPYNIDNGGVTGISVIFNKLFDPAIFISILNWILFFVGWIFLKKEFAVKTLLSTLVYPVFLNVLYHSSLAEVMKTDINDPLLAAILGSVLVGVGLGLVYKVGGSSGGLDVISVMLNKYKGIKISLSTFMLDSIIVLVGTFTVSIGAGLYGIIAIITWNITMFNSLFRNYNDVVRCREGMQLFLTGTKQS